MCPVIHVLGRPVAMYGLCILSGMVLGVLLALRYGRREGISRDDILFSAVYAAIGVLAGGKVLYLIVIFPQIIQNWELLLSDGRHILSLLTGGFVFYGGLFGGLLGGALYCRAYHLSFRRLLFCMLPSIPLIHALGRVGCFMAGCCYGIPYDGPGHVVFSHPVPGAAPQGVPLFPVQLLEAAVNLAICLILVLLMRKARSLSHTLPAYLTLYAAARFFLEFLRGDADRGLFLGLSTSQWLSLLLFAACAASVLHRRSARS